MKYRKHEGTVTRDLLKSRSLHATDNGYPVPKWIEFCNTLLDREYTLYLQEAITTRSKYIYVRKNTKVFKVRFSDHKPSKLKEDNDDCDFYVGAKHNGKWNTTADALEAVEVFFLEDPK